MAKRNHLSKRKSTQLDRVERKCDLLLSELLLLRHILYSRRDEDTLIDRMHSLAKRMRMHSEEERAHAREMLSNSRCHDY